MPPENNQKKFLNAMLLVPGVGYETIRKIRAHFDSYESAWVAPAQKFLAAGIDNKTAANIERASKTINPDQKIRELENDRVSLVCEDDPGFPGLLKEIPSPPMWLYVKGEIKPEENIISVVGSRKATSYGIEATERIISALGLKTSVTITSGLASGIDGAAHRFALRHGLRTVAVIGSGLDDRSLFPPQHVALGREIVARGGAIISEYPLGMPAFKQNFVQRNRIIAGLCMGVLVVEAAEKSGALITANFALEQGKSVMAVPGSIFSPYSGGTNSLLGAGARLVASADDIIDELALETKTTLADAGAVLTKEKEKNILKCLNEPMGVDELMKLLGASAADILSGLSVLELNSLAKNVGGKWIKS